MAKNITLFCSAGMSTSLLASRMQKVADAPQVRFALAKLQKQFPGKPIEAIDMRAYGLMDGKAVLEMAEKKLNA